MSEDPTRATRSPEHGSVGPHDPHADPATDPAMRPVTRTGSHDEDETRPVGFDPPTAPVPTTAPRDRAQERDPSRERDPSQERDRALDHTRSGGLWTGLILSAIVGLFLLVFILQNNVPVAINFLGFSGALPTGVALLLAAIAGLLLVAIPGGLRIMQLRRAAKRAGR